MKVEIWSDVVCPFCYIGKRRFEAALAQFEHANEIEIEWKSFLLNPDLKTDEVKNIYQYLSENKGWTIDYAKQVSQQVTDQAAELGLEFNFEKSVVANTQLAHRLLHLAKKSGQGNAMKERLLLAYFTEGKNIADQDTLQNLASEVGLNANEVKALFETDKYLSEVFEDVYEAQQIGVRGVPYFVVNDKYAISGAQASETFLGALTQAWSEYETNANIAEPQNLAGEVCTPEGDCK